MTLERSELKSSLPVRGGWEGRAFIPPFMLFVVMCAVSPLQEGCKP